MLDFRLHWLFNLQTSELQTFKNKNTSQLVYICFINLFIEYFTETFLCVIMADKSSASASGKKCKASDDSASGRKRQAILMKIKVTIISWILVKRWLMMHVPMA